MTKIDWPGLEMNAVTEYSESPAVPLQISHFGGDGKKIFGANAPTSSPQTSDQVSANACRYTGWSK